MTTSIRRVKTSDLELKDRLVSIQRVTKVTKGGRTFSFSAIVVVGNENGIVGHGLGKANEVTTAIAKGIEDAKKNLIKVPIHKGTIPHEQLAKYGGASVFLKPASSGTGVVAGGAMRAVFQRILKPPQPGKGHLQGTDGTQGCRPGCRTQGRDDGQSIQWLRPDKRKKMAKIRVTQIRSRIGSTARQKKTLDALGLRKMNKTVELEGSPQVLGMVNKVRHLVKVEESK